MRHPRKKEKFYQWLGGLFILFLWAWPALAQQEELPTQGKPLTLEQCTAMALKYHPSLRANQATIEASKARVEQALAAYYPQVDLSGNYTNGTSNYSGITRSGSNRWTFYDSYSVGPSLTQNIYDFGRRANNVTINRENVKANEEDLTTAKQLVVLNVKQAYFGVLQTLRLIQVAEDLVKQDKQRLEQAQGFYQAGTRPKIDVTKAEVDLANAELNLIRAKNNYQLARVTLNNAMGLRESLSFAIEDSMDIKPVQVTLDEILNLSYAQRPELLQLKARQRSLEATVKLAQSSYYPTLSGNASYLYRGPQVENLYWDLFVGATLNIPLFSGFSSPNQVAEARANLRNLQAQEENLKLNIRLEAEQAFLGLKEADERIRVTEKAVGHAQENFELANGRYQVGVGFPLEVTDAEVLLANARANYIQALYDYKVSEARIEKAMGINR
jgi:TolC family type I secretion outer membrane protein